MQHIRTACGNQCRYNGYFNCVYEATEGALVTFDDRLEWCCFIMPQILSCICLVKVFFIIGSKSPALI